MFVIIQDLLQEACCDLVEPVTGCSPLLGDSFLLWLFHMPSFMQLVFIDYSVLVHSSYSPILL